MHNPAPEKHGRMERKGTPVRLGVNPPLGDIAPARSGSVAGPEFATSCGQANARRDRNASGFSR